MATFVFTTNSFTGYGVPVGVQATFDRITIPIQPNRSILPAVMRVRVKVGDGTGVTLVDELVNLVPLGLAEGVGTDVVVELSSAVTSAEALWLEWRTDDRVAFPDLAVTLPAPPGSVFYNDSDTASDAAGVEMGTHRNADVTFASSVSPPRRGSSRSVADLSLTTAQVGTGPGEVQVLVANPDGEAGNQAQRKVLGIADISGLAATLEDLQPGSTAAPHPFAEGATGTNFAQVEAAVVDVRLSGTLPGGYGSNVHVGVLKRNSGGEWRFQINLGTSGNVIALCRFLTTASPEIDAGPSGITVHPLTEVAGSGVSGEVAIRWGDLDPGFAIANQFNATLADSVFDSTFDGYLQESAANPNPTTIPLVAGQEHLQRWFGAFGTALVEGTGSAALACIGDSITNFQNGHTRELARLLKAGGDYALADGGPGWVAPNRVDVQVPDGVTVTYDGTGGLWALLDGSGGTPDAGADGLALDAIRNTATGAILQIETTVPFDRFRVYLVRESGSAGVDTRLDGASQSHVVGAGTVETIERSGFTDAAHTLQVEVTSGTVRILGVLLTRDEGQGVGRVLKLAGGGAQTQNVTGDVSVPVWQAQLDDVNPDLAVAMYGPNDQAQGISVSDYRDNLTALVGTLRAGDPNRSVIIMGPPDNTIAAQSVPITDYVRAAFEVAQAEGCGWVSAYLALGDWTAAGALGLTVDDRHPSAAGARLIARALWDVLGWA